MGEASKLADETVGAVATLWHRIELLCKDGQNKSVSAVGKNNTRVGLLPHLVEITLRLAVPLLTTSFQIHNLVCIR